MYAIKHSYSYLVLNSCLHRTETMSFLDGHEQMIIFSGACPVVSPLLFLDASGQYGLGVAGAVNLAAAMAVVTVESLDLAGCNLGSQVRV